MAAARIQRWALLLSSFNYDIKFKKGKEHANADTLSRFPCSKSPIIEGNVFRLSYVEDLPITAEDIRMATRKDAILGQVINKIKYGWHQNAEVDLVPYFLRHDQLSVQDDCILWGMRMVIPNCQRHELLELLHDTHPGINRMKSIARSHIWWPGIDNDIEKLSKACKSCEQSQRAPPTSTLQSWIWPKKPWERIHVDFGQKGSKYFLIIYDAHSKWIEVIPTNNITTNTTIKSLRYMFSRYGLPYELVSDNGPQFTAMEFGRFLKVNGIKHTLVPAYHPSSNGAAERAVQSVKSALHKMNTDKDDAADFDQMLARYMMVQHNTPHATTGVAPANLFMGRELRDRWTMLHMEITPRVEHNQLRQKINHDRAHSTQTSFEVGNCVLALNGMNNPKWLQGTIVEKQSSKTWMVETERGVRAYHSDQLRHRKPNTEMEEIKMDGKAWGVSDETQITVEDTDTTNHIKQDGKKEQNDEAINQESEPMKDGDIEKVNNEQITVPAAAGTKIKSRMERRIIEPRRNPPRIKRTPNRLDL